MTDKIEAHCLTYENFLTGRHVASSPRLEIGNFQRNYVWAPKRIKKLIEAINENESEYYLGNLVIQKGTRGSGGFDVVVDGQQRMVTLALILTALLPTVSDATSKRRICKLLFEEADLKKWERISFDRVKSKKAYKAILKGSSKPDELDEAEKRLWHRLAIVEKEIKNIDDPTTFLQKVCSLTFVVIKCSSVHDVNKLYEGLNSTGQRLSAVEQTKNLLLGSGVQSQRRRINTSWEKIENSFEKNKPLWFDKFLRHQWFSIGGYVSNANLYDEIRRKVVKKGITLEYSRQLVHDSNTYIILRKAADFSKSRLPVFSGLEKDVVDEIKYLLESISKLNLDQIYALLLALIKYGESGRTAWYVRSDAFLRDLEKLWSFFILAKYSRVNPGRYEKILADYCLYINHNLPSKDEFNDQRKKRLYDELAKLVATSKETFIEVLNEQVKYCTKKGMETGNKHYVTSILMVHLSSGADIVPPRRNTIEHIIPQGSLVHWKKISASSSARVDVARFQLGNLTLISKSTSRDLNQSISNASFNKKYKNVFAKDKIFAKNKEVSRYENKFNSKNPSLAVKERGRDMASAIYDALFMKLIS